MEEITIRQADPVSPPQTPPETCEVLLGEHTIDELNTRTGRVDPATGVPFTFLGEIEAREHEEHPGGRVFTQIGDRLSVVAQQANKAIHNRRVRRGAGIGALTMSVIAVRQVIKNHDTSTEK